MRVEKFFFAETTECTSSITRNSSHVSRENIFYLIYFSYVLLNLIFCVKRPVCILINFLFPFFFFFYFDSFNWNNSKIKYFRSEEYRYQEVRRHFRRTIRNFDTFRCLTWFSMIGVFHSYRHRFRIMPVI